MPSVIETVIKAAAFLLGMVLSVQLLAALYGVIDQWYVVRATCHRIVGKIALWGTLAMLASLALGGAFRPAFLWGLGSLLMLQVVSFIGMKLLVRRNIRLLDQD